MNKCLEIVLKITERCNIDCTYCYVFNKGDTSYKNNPPVIKKSTLDSLIIFLQKAIENDGVSTVIIDFHGGEPLLMKKTDFESVCKRLTRELGDICQLKLAIQTNGTLVDEEWITIFSKYQLTVGVSLDGPESINDECRVDFSGRGTFASVMKGYKLLESAYNKKQIPHLGILSVASTKLTGQEAYNFFIKELKSKSVNFLLPSEPHQLKSDPEYNTYGQFMCELFDAWVDDGAPKGVIRLLDETVSAIICGNEYAEQLQKSFLENHVVLTVSSNGGIGAEDSLKLAKIPNLFDKFNVNKDTYSDFVNSEVFQGLLRAKYTLSDSCNDCCWQNLCQGGSYAGGLVTRFKTATGFNNASKNCASLESFYSHIASDLLQRGHSYDFLEKQLLHNAIAWDKFESKCEFAQTNMHEDIYQIEL